MSSQTQTANISHTIVDVPVIPDETPPATQRASKLFKELDSEKAKFHIAPLGLNNFLYNAAHLFLPYFYSSRAYVVLSSATLTEEEIRSLFAEAASKDGGITLKHWPDVKKSWTEFLDSLSNEWKTLNLVSALLLTAIYNVLQLGGRGNSLTQSTALMSLLSALMSLLFGCLYLIRFETMRRTYKAIQWSSDALKTSQTIFWNIYILLALPSVWLAWSLVFFVVCLMSIVWQPIDETIGSTSGLGPLHLATKIVVSALLFVGMAHLSLALFTFARYGSRLDKTWTKKLESFSGAIRPDAEATNSTSKSSSFEDSRPPYSRLLSASHSSPEWPSPHTATVGRPFDNGGPSYSHLLSSPYSSPYWPSPYTAKVDSPFDNSRPHSHLQSSPYSLWPSPYTATSGRPFDNGRPPHSHLLSSPFSSPYPVPLGRPSRNNGPPYSLSPYPSPYGPYSIGRPIDNSRPINNSRPLNYSRPINESRSMNNSRPINNGGHVNNNGHVNNINIDNSRPLNDPDRRTINSTMAYPRPWTRIEPVRHSDFTARPPSAP